MPTLAIVLVLVAAVLHAGWNVLLKTSGDTLTTAVRLQAIGTAVLVPIGVVAWLANGSPAVSSTAIALALGSAVPGGRVLRLPRVGLPARRCSRSSTRSLAGARRCLRSRSGSRCSGSSWCRSRSPAWRASSSGSSSSRSPGRRSEPAGAKHRGAIGFALLTGASIAGYSAVDRVGVRETEPWIYGSILAVASSIFTATAVIGGRRLGLLAPAPATPARGDQVAGTAGTGARFGGLARDAVAGVLSLGAYLLVLLAYSFAPLATVAPLRESGIVLAAAWGALRLKESAGGRDAITKIAAASLVVLGAILLAVAR